MEAEKQNNQEENAKMNMLFNTIQYADESAYEEFIKKMNISQAIFCLMASANFAQAKGAFNLLESECLAKAIRVIKQTTNTNSEKESVESENAAT